MKYIKMLFCGAMLMCLLHSCRQEDDFVKSYGGNDNIVMSEAKKSFTKQFDALWNAVNSNYTAWEIETVDWDNVYDKYYPKFVELDTLIARGDSVGDKQLEDLYTEILDTLHDGHSVYAIQNLYSEKYVTVCPQKLRNARRFGKNAEVSVPYDISYYKSELVPENERFFSLYLDMSCKGTILQYLTSGKENLNKAYLNAETAEEKKGLLKFVERIDTAYSKIQKAPRGQDASIITFYNELAAEAHDARMPQYKTEINANYRMEMLSAISNDGIAYFRLSNFYLLPFIMKKDADLSKMKQKGLEGDSILYKQVRETWMYWFGGIQALSANGRLKGVIIDVRGNGGGINYDQMFILGALLPTGGHKVGTYKMKKGTGRLDYSVNMDFEIATMTKEHVTIDNVPIVVLADHQSVSNAEMTAVAVKQLPNGILIGSQTYGALSSLLTGWGNYSTTYSGEFGEYGKTPIYGYQPMCLASYDGFGVLESIGVTPSEGYNMEYQPTTVTDAQGKQLIRDNQLEAALKCIRSK